MPEKGPAAGSPRSASLAVGPLLPSGERARSAGRRARDAAPWWSAALAAGLAAGALACEVETPIGARACACTLEVALPDGAVAELTIAAVEACVGDARAGACRGADIDCSGLIDACDVARARCVAEYYGYRCCEQPCGACERAAGCTLDTEYTCGQPVTDPGAWAGEGTSCEGR